MWMMHLPGVCPFDIRRASATSEPAFQPRTAVKHRTLAELACVTEDEFRQQFKGTPVKRAKWKGMRRSVEAAIPKWCEEGKPSQ
jgi:epoxyqueuosine reductase